MSPGCGLRAIGVVVINDIATYGVVTARVESEDIAVRQGNIHDPIEQNRRGGHAVREFASLPRYLQTKLFASLTSPLPM
jgi:hypothetical protein